MATQVSTCAEQLVREINEMPERKPLLRLFAWRVRLSLNMYMS